MERVRFRFPIWCGMWMFLLETREMLERMPEDFPEDYAKATQLALEKIREGDAQVVLN